MDNLCSLQVMCSSMRHICGGPVVARCVAVDWCRPSLSNDCVKYFTLLARLTQFGYPEACLLTGIQTVFVENHSPRSCLDYLTRITDGGHNMAAYQVTIFLYRNNGGVGDDNTVRQYKRWIEGEEESRVTVASDGGRPTSRQLSNKGCWLCCEAVVNLIHKMMWWRNKWPPPPSAQERGDLPCAGADCGIPKG
jgi:hypothetical protein